MLLAILFAVFLGLLALRVPVGVALVLSSVSVMLLQDLNLVNAVTQSYRTLDSFALMAIPFFLGVGLLTANTSMAQRLLELADLMIGRIRGGLGHVNVVSSMLFGGVSGSATSDVASLGAILIPMMKRRGYPADYSAVITAASSTMGLILPPSLVMVVYGAFLNTSVGALFIAGILPGILMGLMMLVVNAIYTKVHDLDPPRSRAEAQAEFAAINAGAPHLSTGSDRQGLLARGLAIIAPRLAAKLVQGPSEQGRRPWYVVVMRGLPVLGIPVIIVVGVRGGIFTPTEAGAIALIYLLILATVIYRELTWAGLRKISKDSLLLYSQPLFAVAASGIFGWVLSLLGAADMVRDFIGQFDFTPQMFMICVLVVFTIIGLFLDAVPAIIIFAPLFVPGAAELGVHPVHLGAVVTMVLGIAMITPPYGLSLLMASRIAKVSLWSVSKAAVPFCFVCYLVAIAFALSEPLTLFLPRLLAPNLF